MKADIERLQVHMGNTIKEQASAASIRIAALKRRLCAQSEFGALSGDKQAQIAAPFDEFINSIANGTLIAVMRDAASRFEEVDYPKQLERMTAWAKPDRADDSSSPSDGQPTVVTSRSIQVAFEKALLTDVADVESYIQALRKAMLEAISSGKRIQV